MRGIHPITNQHIALVGREAVLEVYAERDDAETTRGFEVEATNVQRDAMGTTALWLFMRDDSVVRVTWLPKKRPPERADESTAALELARLIAK